MLPFYQLASLITTRNESFGPVLNTYLSQDQVFAREPTIALPTMKAVVQLQRKNRSAL
jgi:hypothetical protein